MLTVGKVVMMNVSGDRVCATCIMDTSDPNIAFDDNGVCRYCKEYEGIAERGLHQGEAGKEDLSRLVSEMKRNGRKKRYDCMLGIGGGVDCSFLAYTLKNLGLRPLLVSVNNGWDTDVASSNIDTVASKLNMGVRRLNLELKQFRDLQVSFLKSSTSNCEIPTDHVVVATLFHTAAKEDIRYLVTGGNIVTEAIYPESWGYHWRDWRFIAGVHRRFGKVSLRGLPHLTLLDWTYFLLVKRIRYVSILNYVPYVKKDAKRLLQQELGWRDYGSKHYESVYTRFFQGYILPTKFGIDKRRVHLSNLIWSGQMTRAEAMDEVSRSPYPSEDMLRQDRKYVLEKLGLSEEEFSEIMSQPVKKFTDYPNEDFLYRRLPLLVRFARGMATRNV